jgi:hypothetical protein
VPVRDSEREILHKAKSSEGSLLPLIPNEGMRGALELTSDTGKLSYSFTRLNRNALVITDTLLKLIAAAAMIGDKSMPNLG